MAIRLCLRTPISPRRAMPRICRSSAATDWAIPQLLDAILQFFPLDRYVPQPVTLMETLPGEQVDTSIWREYESLFQKHETLLESGIRHM